MRRRRLLWALGAGVAGLAGCPSAEERARTDRVTPAPVPTLPEETPGGFGNGSQIETTDTIESPTLGRTFSVGLETGPTVWSTEPFTTIRFSATVTDEHPARLAGAVVNRSADSQTVDLSTNPLFGSVPTAVPEGGADTDALVLVPTTNHETALQTPTGVRLPNGRWRLATPADGPLVRAGPVTLDPGTRLQFEYRLFGHPAGDGFPTGRYHFEGDDQRVTVATWETGDPEPTTRSRSIGTSSTPSRSLRRR